MKTLLIALAASAAMTLPAAVPAQAQQGPPDQMQTGPSKQGISPQTMSDSQIRQVQQALKDKGHYKGEVDGIWGPETAAALREFGSQSGQDSTQRSGADQIDPQTLMALGLNPDEFRTGTTGPGSPGSPPSIAPGAPPSGTQPSSPGTSPGLKPDNSSSGGPGAPGTGPSSPGSGQNQ